MIIVVGIISAALILVLILKWRQIWEFCKNSNPADRCSIIVFSIVSAVSLILLIYGAIWPQDEGTLRSLILLTITSVTVSVLMDRVGVLSSIEKKMKTGSNLRTRTEIENEYPLYEMWKDAEEVKVVTMGGAVFFIGKLKDNLDSVLRQGTRFTFVNIKQETESWKEHYNNKMENKTEENMFACLSVPKTVTDNYNRKIEYYQTEVNLPYALMYVEKKKNNKSFVKVDLYSIDIPDGDRPCMMFYQGEPHYDFFKNQIEVIIRKSEKIQ